MPIDQDNKASTSWKPTPKILAAIIVGAVVYLLGAVGVDVGQVLHDVGDAIGVDVPDTQALSTLLAALIAGYMKSND